MLSWLEVTQAWGTVQDQPVGRDFCPDTVLKRHSSHLGSWAQDAAVCGKTHTSRVPSLGLGEGGELYLLCLDFGHFLSLTRTRPQPDL